MATSACDSYRPWGGWPAAGSALGVLLAASALLLPLSLIGRNLRWPRARTTLVWSGMLALGLFSSLFVLTVLRDALLLTWSALLALSPGALVLPSQNWRCFGVTPRRKAA